MIGIASLIDFRLGVKDAQALESEFDIAPQDFKLTELQPDTAYVKQDQSSRLRMPVDTFPLYPSHPSKIRNRSRQYYGVERRFVEQKIVKFMEGLNG